MMAGMLVLVERDAEPVDKAATAINTLFGVDPEFVEFCKTIYGDDIDPVDVYEDVFKGNPTGADMSIMGQRRREKKHRLTDKQKRGLVAGASAAGAVAGTVGLAAGVKELRAARAAGKPMSRLGRGLLIAEPVGLTGEVGATHILGRDARKKDPGVPGVKAARDAAIAKLSVPGVHQMAHGIEAGIRGKLIPKLAQPFKEAKMGATGAKMRRGGQFAQQSTAYRAGSTFAGSPTRRLATGGAVVGAAAVGGNQMRKRDDSDLEVTWAGEFSKFDDDKRLVFGWASVVELNGVPVVDRQGDYIHPDDLENASYEYVIKSRVGGDMHRRSASDIPVKVSDLVESMVFTPEKIEKMGLPDAAKEKIPTGWWVGFKVHDDEAWDLVKKRGRGGFSIHGRGKRVEKHLDEVMGY